MLILFFIHTGVHRPNGRSRLSTRAEDMLRLHTDVDQVHHESHPLNLANNSLYPATADQKETRNILCKWHHAFFESCMHAALTIKAHTYR